MSSLANSSCGCGCVPCACVNPPGDGCLPVTCTPREVPARRGHATRATWGDLNRSGGATCAHREGGSVRAQTETKPRGATEIHCRADIFRPTRGKSR